MKTLGIIPARGGSKRFPRKNIAPFLGRPAIAATIEAARDSGCFERCVVSTEDAEIAAIAAEFGGDVDARPAEFATDEARLSDVCLDLLDREFARGRRYDAICVLYAPAVLRDAGDIRATCDLLEPGVCNFSQAVCRYDHYAHQALKLGAGGRIEPMWPDLADCCAKELPPLVCGNGSTYAALVPAFRASGGSFVGPLMKAHEMPRWKSVDIDYPDDLVLAEFFASRYAHAVAG